MKNLSNKLKQVLFAVLVFSFGIGTAQAEVCPDPGSFYSFKGASIEGNHETGDVVSCHYVSTDSSKEEKTINSSEYVKNYLTVTPSEIGEAKPWTGEDKLACDSDSPDRLKCIFSGVNSEGLAYPSIFPRYVDLSKGHQVSLNNTDSVPCEYSSDPDRYWEILQQYDQCTGNQYLCDLIKNAKLAEFQADCTIQDILR